MLPLKDTPKRESCLLALAIALLCPLSATADDLNRQWWVQDAKESVRSQAEGSSGDETIVVPGYFAEQPKPYERPTEIILPKTPTYGSGLLTPLMGFRGYGAPILGAGPLGGLGAASIPYVGSSIPYVGSSIPYVGSSIPYVGASIPYAGSAIPYIGSALPYSGFGLGGIGGLAGTLGGLSYGGLAGIGGFGGIGGLGGLGGYAAPFVGGVGPYGYGGFNPAGSALFMGAFGNRLNNSKLGQVGTNRVIQTAPSKASGNYYAPSNVDTSASGSYYATGAPAVVPYMKQKKAPSSYWGSGGSPFKDVNLNSTPWSK